MWQNQMQEILDGMEKKFNEKREINPYGPFVVIGKTTKCSAKYVDWLFKELRKNGYKPVEKSKKNDKGEQEFWLLVRDPDVSYCCAIL